MAKARVARGALAALLAAPWTFPVPATGAGAPAAFAVPAPTGGIRGTVRLEGSRPAPVLLRVTRDRRFCGDEKISPRLTLSPDGGVRDAVVTVEGAQGRASPAKGGAVVVDNRACDFTPHVQAAVVGQTLVIRNSDPFLHAAHVYFGDGRTWFNLALPAWRRPIRRRLERPGLLRIECNVHAWKWAFVYVSPHAFAATTDASGRFRIDGLPPGTHALRLWHEALGIQRQAVAVEAGRDVEVRLGFPSADRSPGGGAVERADR
jgi:hypothetical protein